MPLPITTFDTTCVCARRCVCPRGINVSSSSGVEAHRGWYICLCSIIRRLYQRHDHHVGRPPYQRRMGQVPSVTSSGSPPHGENHGCNDVFGHPCLIVIVCVVACLCILLCVLGTGLMSNIVFDGSVLGVVQHRITSQYFLAKDGQWVGRPQAALSGLYNGQQANVLLQLDM